jgi:hypothetical protein
MSNKDDEEARLVEESRKPEEERMAKETWNDTEPKTASLPITAVQE